MGRRVTSSASLCFVALALCAAEAAFSQENALQSKALPATQLLPQSYVAVMGQVGRPAVYEVRQSPIELTEVIRMAGGLSDQASGSVRIIRRGRGGQQVFFTPQSRGYTLADGDLIVADPKGYINHRGLPGSSKHRVVGIEDIQSGPTETEPAGVEIGLVQLIGRPVVLDISAARATVAATLDLLNQSLPADGIVTVLRPNGSREEVTSEAAAKTVLTSGSVLVFDPRTVNGRNLPRLPAVIRQSGAETMPPSTLSELEQHRLPKPLTSASSAETSAATSAFQTSNGADRAVAPDLLPTASAAGTASAFVPRQEQPGETKLGSSAPTSGRLQTELTVDDLPDPSPAAESADPIDSPSKSSAAVAELKNSSSGHPVVGMAVPFLVIGGVFVLVFAVLRSMARPSQPLRPAVLPASARRGWSLNDLIENRIPVTEELLPFPVEFQVHGPAPRHDRQLRADRAQSTPRPHFIEHARKPMQPTTPRSGRSPFTQQSPARKAASTGNSAGDSSPAPIARPIEKTPPAKIPPLKTQAVNTQTVKTQSEKTQAVAGEPAQIPHPSRRVDRAFLSLKGGRS